MRRFRSIIVRFCYCDFHEDPDEGHCRGHGYEHAQSYVFFSYESSFDFEERYRQHTGINRNRCFNQKEGALDVQCTGSR